MLQLATSRRAGVPCFLPILAALWNSRRRVVRWEDHQGLEWCEGLETGMCSFRRAVSRSRDLASHLSRSIGGGHMGAGGILKSFMIGVRVSRSISDHRGRLGLGTRVRGARSIVIRT